MYSKKGGRSKRNYFKAKLVSVIGTCAFCQRAVDDEVIYGKLYEIGDIQCHYFCVLLSCCLIQKGRDDEGLFGFLYPDIIAEVERSKKHRCSYCGREGANVGCSIGPCRKQFHLPCGREKHSLTLFYGNYKTFCSVHAPRQKVPESIAQNIKLRSKVRRVPSVCGVSPVDEDPADPSLMCVICYEPVDGSPGPMTFWPPCCARDAWFHRLCLQRMALSAGLHYLKCPLCNDKENFYEAVVAQGYYVPDRDAAWELEQNAFADIYERPVSCCASVCNCPSGRDHDSDEGEWDIKLCILCGSSAIHAGCTDKTDELNIFICGTCKPAAPTNLQALIEKVERVQLQEQATESSRRGPIMPSRMSLRRTKGRAAIPGPSCSRNLSQNSRKTIGELKEQTKETTEQGALSNKMCLRQPHNTQASNDGPSSSTDSTQSQCETGKTDKPATNTESSRLQLNLSRPKRRITQTVQTFDNSLLSSIKMLELGLSEKLAQIPSDLMVDPSSVLEKMMERIRKPRPLVAKKRMINNILEEIFNNILEGPKNMDSVLELVSPKKPCNVKIDDTTTKPDDSTDKIASDQQEDSANDTAKSDIDEKPSKQVVLRYNTSPSSETKNKNDDSNDEIKNIFTKDDKIHSKNDLIEETNKIFTKDDKQTEVIPNNNRHTVNDIATGEGDTILKRKLSPQCVTPIKIRKIDSSDANNEFMDCITTETDVNENNTNIKEVSKTDGNNIPIKSGVETRKVFKGVKINVNINQRRKVVKTAQLNSKTLKTRSDNVELPKDDDMEIVNESEIDNSKFDETVTGNSGKYVKIRRSKRRHSKELSEENIVGKKERILSLRRRNLKNVLDKNSTKSSKDFRSTRKHWKNLSLKRKPKNVILGKDDTKNLRDLKSTRKHSKKLNLRRKPKNVTSDANDSKRLKYLKDFSEVDGKAQLEFKSKVHSDLTNRVLTRDKNYEENNLKTNNFLKVNDEEKQVKDKSGDLTNEAIKKGDSQKRVCGDLTNGVITKDNSQEEVGSDLTNGVITKDNQKDINVKTKYFSKVNDVKNVILDEDDTKSLRKFKRNKKYSKTLSSRRKSKNVILDTNDSKSSKVTEVNDKELKVKGEVGSDLINAAITKDQKDIDLKTKDIDLKPKYMNSKTKDIDSKTKDIDLKAKEFSKVDDKETLKVKSEFGIDMTNGAITKDNIHKVPVSRDSETVLNLATDDENLKHNYIKKQPKYMNSKTKDIDSKTKDIDFKAKEFSKVDDKETLKVKSEFGIDMTNAANTKDKVPVSRDSETVLNLATDDKNLKHNYDKKHKKTRKRDEIKLRLKLKKNDKRTKSMKAPKELKQYVLKYSPEVKTASETVKPDDVTPKRKQATARRTSDKKEEKKRRKRA